MLSEPFPLQAYKDEFSRHRRLVIKPLFTESVAEEARRCLAEQLPWSLTYALNRQPRRSSREQLAAMVPEARQQMMQDIHMGARGGSGFLYSSYFLSDAYLSGSYPNVIAIEILKYLNSPEFIGLIREITEDHTINSADAQATLFGPGHFLTRHNDVDPANERRIAYVIGLSKPWHPDWGGLLQFFHRDGTPDIAIAPQFNVMSLFDVTQPHSVTMVTPFAGGGRLSITGWFRCVQKV